MHAGKTQRLGLVYAHDARGGVRACDQRDMPHARHGDVGGEAALADDEAPVLAHAAIGRDKAEALSRRAHGSLTGWFKPRMRSEAKAMASTIWA